jgi:hypothetical protein
MCQQQRQQPGSRQAAAAGQQQQQPRCQQEITHSTQTAGPSRRLHATHDMQGGMRRLMRLKAGHRANYWPSIQSAYCNTSPWPVVFRETKFFSGFYRKPSSIQQLVLVHG